MQVQVYIQYTVSCSIRSFFKIRLLSDYNGLRVKRFLDGLVSSATFFSRS